MTRLNVWLWARLPLAGMLAGCEVVAGIQDIALTNRNDAAGAGSDAGGGASPGADGASSTNGADDGAVDGGDATVSDESSADASRWDSTATPEAAAEDALSSAEVDGPSDDAAGSRASDATGAASDATGSDATGSDATGSDAGAPGLSDASTAGPDVIPSDASDGGRDAATSLVLIDDMEKQVPSAGWLDGPTVTGTWFTFDDGSDGGVIAPVPSPVTAAPIIADVVPPRVTASGALSAHAAHVTVNGGFAVYAGMGFNLNVVHNTPAGFDASAMIGIVFWARAGGSSPASLRVEFLDVNTTPPPSGTCDGGACNGAFGVDLGKNGTPALTNDWQLYTVNFADLQRPPWASNDMQPFDNTKIVSCDFKLPPNTAADLWVDDVSFITR